MMTMRQSAYFTRTALRVFAKLTQHLSDHWSIYLLLLIYLSTRLVSIEADLPAWARMHYQTVDELYYAHPAYDWLHSNRGSFENRPFNLLQNLVVFVSASVFGWSYFSLRLGALFMGGVGMVLIYLSCATISKKENYIQNSSHNLIFFISGFFIVLNIGFYYSTVVLEPSIAVAAFAAALILCISRFENKPWLIGGLIIFGPLFVYPYAIIYSIPAVLIFFWLTWKNGARYFIQSTLGGLVVVVVYVLLVSILNPSLLSEGLKITATHGTSRLIDVTKYPIGYLLDQFFVNDIPSINIFQFSKAALILFCISILLFILRLGALRGDVKLTVLLVLLMLGARFSFLFIEKTHFERKMIDISFIFLFLIYYSANVIYSAILGVVRSANDRFLGRWKIALLFASFFLMTQEAYSFFRELAQNKSYNNRDSLIKLGEYLEGCVAIGEWGLGLNIYGRYDVKLNTYQYFEPGSYISYSDALNRLLQSPQAVVVSSVPVSQKISEELRAQLVAIYSFDINDGGDGLSPYAVYVPRARLDNSSGAIPCRKSEG